MRRPSLYFIVWNYLIGGLLSLGAGKLPVITLPYLYSYQQNDSEPCWGNLSWGGTHPADFMLTCVPLYTAVASVCFISPFLSAFQFRPLRVMQFYHITISAIMAVQFLSFLGFWATWAMLFLMAIWDLVAVLCPFGSVYQCISVKSI